MKRLGEFIVAGKDISSDEELAKHADWVETFIGSYDSVTEENVEEILQKEIGDKPHKAFHTLFCIFINAGML